jgi:cell division septation protein DedD
LASFKDLNSAKKFAARFRGLKHKATIREVELSGKGRWYRVQVGKLASREEATALANDLSQIPSETKRQRGTLLAAPKPLRRRREH